jgi:hypothetical protein
MENRNQKWVIDDNQAMCFNGSIVKDSLPKAVYLLKYEKMIGMFLEKVSDNFIFNHELYNSGSDRIIKRCVNSWNKSETNLGILFNGLKGSGKSVTAKLICNEINLPVILINKNIGDISEYINNIQQDIIIFIDEFEKIFPYQMHSRNNEDDKANKDSNMLLSLMDGAFTSEYKRLFIATTNTLIINPFLLERPSRFRYTFNFTNVDNTTLNELIDKLLVNKEFETDLIETINTLENYSVDTVISIIKEMNLYNEKASDFIDFFNVKRKDSETYDIYEMNDDGTYELAINHTTSLDYFSKSRNDNKRKDIIYETTKFGGWLYEIIHYENGNIKAYKYEYDEDDNNNRIKDNDGKDIIFKLKAVKKSNYTRYSGDSSTVAF